VWHILAWWALQIIQIKNINEKRLNSCIVFFFRYNMLVMGLQCKREYSHVKAGKLTLIKNELRTLRINVLDSLQIVWLLVNY